MSRADVRILPVAVDGPDATRCLAAYRAELVTRLPAGFDASADPATDYVPPDGVFLIAYEGVDPIGCVGVRRLDQAAGELKRMWVAAERRGQGVGVMLLTEVERRAIELGFVVLRLDTASVLTEAIALYRRSGYASVSAYNDNPHAELWFEKRF